MTETFDYIIMQNNLPKQECRRA